MTYLYTLALEAWTVSQSHLGGRGHEAWLTPGWLLYPMPISVSKLSPNSCEEQKTFLRSGVVAATQHSGDRGRRSSEFEVTQGTRGISEILSQALPLPRQNKTRTRRSFSDVFCLGRGTSDICDSLCAL